MEDATEAGQDLRTALENAFKEAKEPEVKAEVKTEAEKPEVSAEAQRARDEQGRFAKQEAAAEKAAEVKAETVVKADETAKVEKPEEAKRAPAPPNGWSAEAKAKWHELPPEIMSAVAQREADLGRAAGKMDEERALGRDVSKVFQPYMPILQAEGTTPIQAVQSLLNTAYILRQGSPQQKKAALLETAKQFGIDITPDTRTSATNANPELSAIQQELAQLKGQLSARDTQVQSASDAQMRQEIDAFAADSANVYFAEVKPEMAALLSAGRAKDLKTAYDMACWARPDIRSSIQAQTRADDERKRREAAEEARRKAVSVTGAPGVTAAPSAGSRSLREELEANMAALRGAV